MLQRKEKERNISIRPIYGRFFIPLLLSFSAVLANKIGHNIDVLQFWRWQHQPIAMVNAKWPFFSSEIGDIIEKKRWWWLWQQTKRACILRNKINTTMTKIKKRNKCHYANWLNKHTLVQCINSISMRFFFIHAMNIELPLQRRATSISLNHVIIPFFTQWAVHSGAILFCLSVHRTDRLSLR